MRHTYKQKKRSRKTHRHRGGYDSRKARARVASLQQMLGNASTKVASVKSDLATVTKESPGPVTETPVTVVNLPVEAEAAPSRVKASTFAAKNNAPVSFAPQRPPSSPFGKPQTRMAKVSNPAAPKASLPPSSPPPPALESEEEEEEEPQHASLERQKGKRYLRKPAHLRFSNLEEEGPVADPTVFGTNFGTRSENWYHTKNLMASRSSIRPSKYRKEKQEEIYQPLSQREAQIFAEVTRNANTANTMIKALNKYKHPTNGADPIPKNSADRIIKKIRGVYGENE